MRLYIKSAIKAFAIALVFAMSLPMASFAQNGDALVAPYSSEDCASCAEWNAPHEPFRIHGNTYYVGTHGLSAVLVTSDDGHILIDGGLPDSAPMVIANIDALGFRIGDVKLILNSHAHFDHAGGIAALQRASGGLVAASPSSAAVLERGTPGPDDPQYAVALPYPAVPNVKVIADDETLRVGSAAVTAHFTPGHTPGGTSWSWQSCEANQCLDLVYADSQTPVSADDFLFSRSETYPSAIADFERGFAVLERLSCDVLITPHPAASGLWERMADSKGTLVDKSACRRYAAQGRGQLARRLEAEAQSHER